MSATKHTYTQPAPDGGLPTAEELAELRRLLMDAEELFVGRLSQRVAHVLDGRSTEPRTFELVARLGYTVKVMGRACVDMIERLSAIDRDFELLVESVDSQVEGRDEWAEQRDALEWAKGL